MNISLNFKNIFQNIQNNKINNFRTNLDTDNKSQNDHLKFNNDCIHTKLSLELPIINKKTLLGEKKVIVVGSKEFKELKDAINYAVKQSNPYAYNITIQDLKIMPNKIFAKIHFNSQQEKPITAEYYVYYGLVDSFFSPIQFYAYEVKDRNLKGLLEKIITQKYGKFKNLIISYQEPIEEGKKYRIYKVGVNFIDIPD